MDFLEDFGVKPVFLLAQVVNFLLLLFILKRFLYKPVLKVLEERKQKITDSLKNADEIEKKLEAVTLEREKRLKEASYEAGDIIRQASQTADGIIAQAHQKAAKDIEKMVSKSEEAMKLEREKLHQEIKTELSGLVTLALQKVTGQVISEKQQKELIEKSIRGIVHSK